MNTEIYSENMELSELLDIMTRYGVISGYDGDALERLVKLDTDISDTVVVSRGGVPVMKAKRTKKLSSVNRDFILITDSQEVNAIKDELGGERRVSQVGDFGGMFVEPKEDGEVWAFAGIVPDLSKTIYRLR